MLELQHPNIVALKHSFFSFVHNSEQSDKESSVTDLVKINYKWKKKKEIPNLFFVKLSEKK